MSVKIKINWDNENVVSESVRIYRADSAFTSETLPPLLTEITGDVYEYEDLTTIEGITYFYMLSAKFGEQEAFTECFEVLASALLWFSTPQVTNISSLNLENYHSLTGTATRSNMSTSLSDGTKWRGGVLGGDGKIYCVPYNSADILIIDPATQTATRSNMGASLSGSTKWGGGVLGGDGKIYCVPSSSTNILIIDPATQTATRSNMDASLSDSDKWVGGVLGGDGKIYCVPSSSADILIIDPATQTATRSNMGASLSDSNKWHGGVLGGDGKIYCAPSSSADILIIDKNSGVPVSDLKYVLSPHLNKF